LALVSGSGGDARSAFCIPSDFAPPADCSWQVDDVTVA